MKQQFEIEFPEKAGEINLTILLSVLAAGWPDYSISIRQIHGGIPVESRVFSVLPRQRQRLQTIMGAVARGWCSDENKHKILDPTLAMSIAEEVAKLENL